jgi:hypothetical protein
MSEIIFRSPCPSVTCEDKTIYRWYHHGCPSSSKEYLSWNAEIRCDYCGKKWDFFNSLFYCENSNNKWEKSNLKKAINCFTALFMANELSADFLIKIKNSLTEQEKKYI